MELPADFVLRTRALLGNAYPQFEEALGSSSPVSIRLNKEKGLQAPATAQPIPWCSTGYYLPERLTFTFDPLFHAGGYYVQEASSMFLEQAVKETVNGAVKCLDLCAAPGGKSTHLAGLLPAGSLLVSNEVIRNRAQVLAENLTKWGRPEVIISNNDPQEIGQLTHYFDLIVADVPCSGEGMFRKDEDSRQEWSTANVELCAARQKRIVHAVWEALKPGGVFIYSTCTYNTEENEENIRYIAEQLGADVIPLSLPATWNVSGALQGNDPVYRFLPHKTRGEGFFITVLRKHEGKITPVKQKNKTSKNKVKETIPDSIQNWLKHPSDFHFNTHNNVVEAFPFAYKEDLLLLTDKLRIVSAGIKTGESKGKDLIPHPALAWSKALNPTAFQQSEITWSDAIRFLRKEAISLPANAEKGYHLVTYKKLPLGFVKHLGNRANNLYPSEWRIRTGYTPEEIRVL